MPSILAKVPASKLLGCCCFFPILPKYIKQGKQRKPVRLLVNTLKFDFLEYQHPKVQFPEKNSAEAPKARLNQ